MESAGKRVNFIRYIAYLQAIGIVLVVFGHSFHQATGEDAAVCNRIFAIMHNFRMPLFMFVSGFLMMYTTFCPGKDVTPRRFIRNKFRRLIVPFLFLSVVTFLPRCFLTPMADDVVSLNWESFFKGLFSGYSLTVPTLWFLQASFITLIVCFTVVWAFKKLSFNLDMAFILLMVIFMTTLIMPYNVTDFFSLGEVCNLGIFFVAGMIFCRFGEKVEKYLRLDSPVVFVGFLALWFGLFLWLEDTPLYFISSFFGIGMCVSLARILDSRNIRLLDWIVGSNYIIFLLHWYTAVMSQQVLHHVLPLHWAWHSLLAFTLGIVLPILFLRLLQRKAPQSRFYSGLLWLLGQNKIRREVNFNICRDSIVCCPKRDERSSAR